MKFPVHKFSVGVLLVWFMCIVHSLFPQATPNTITGLAVWLNADSSVANGMNQVSSMNDQSGNGNNAVQSNASFQPLKTNSNPIINNKPTILFDGSDDYMDISDNVSVDFTTGFTAFILFKQTTYTPVKTLLAKWYYGTESSWAIETSSSDGIKEYIANSLTDAGGNQIDAQGNTSQLSNFNLLCFIYDGTQSGLNVGRTYINDIQLNNSISGTIASSLINSSANIRIGSFANLGRFFNGEYAEIIIYNKSLNSTERLEVENYLYDKYAPNISIGNDTISPTFCGMKLTAHNHYNNQYSFLWSTGETSDTISVYQSGTYWLQATNIFGKVSFDTITVGFPQIATLHDTTFCFGNSVMWDTGLDKSSFSFQWSDNSTDSLINVNQSGQYFVKVTDTSSCFIYSDTIIFVRDELANNVSLGPDTSICAGNYITILSGNSPNLTYLWNDGSTNDTLTVFNSNQYSIIVSDTNSCIAKDTINVNIAGQAPTAGFEHLTACANNSVTFNDTSFTTDGSNIVQWFWNFGDNTTLADTAHTPAPSYVFPNAGNYNVTLTITTDAGCEQSIAKIVYVNPLPTLNLGPDTTLCSGNVITPITATGNGLTYMWGDGSVNDSIEVSSAGNYTLTITTDAGCSTSDTINVTISGQAPIADFSTGATCQNSEVYFTDISTPPAGNTITAWHWNLGDASTLADTSNSQNTFYLFPDTGFYNVSLIVYTDAGCKQSVSKQVHIFPVPKIQFTSSLACQNDSTVFTNQSGDNGYSPISYSWNFGDNSSGINNFSSLNNPSHLFSQQTSYTVTLIGTNPYGCSDSLKQSINVLHEVSANFNYTSTCTGISIHFTDNSIVPSPGNSSLRYWLIESGNYTGTSVNHVFSSSGNYDITLLVVGSNGCTSTTTKTINVSDPPNTLFTQTNLCLNDTAVPVNATQVSGKGIEQWKWYLDGNISSTVQNPSFSGLTNGSHNLKLLAIDSAGCKDSVTHAFNVNDLPTVNFNSTPDSFSYAGIPTIFLSTGTNATQYNWTINNQSYSSNPLSYVFDSVGNYTIQLNTIDSNGCRNSTSKNLNVLRYRLDLAIIAVRTTVDANNFVRVEADLSNLGSVPVSNFDISYHVSNSSVVKETWSGSPANTLFFTYKFNAQTQLLESSDNMITCVTIESVNSTQDDNITNNSLCIASNLAHPSVLDIFPNPANNYIVVPVILTETLDITLTTYDALGQSALIEKSYTGVQGLNLIKLPVEELSEGAYFIHITIGNKSFVKKFAKTN